MTLQIGAISYAAAAVAFAFLCLLLVTSWRGRLQGAVLALACAVSALWGAAAIYQAAWATEPGLTLDLLEILRSASWLGFLLLLLGFSRKPTEPAHQTMRLVTGCLALFCTVLLGAAAYSHAAAAPPRVPNHFSGILGPLVLALIGMLLVEQVYRNAAPEHRWGIKFLCLGLGGMFAYDFYLYSDALLFKQIDTTVWEARGVVNALVVPCVAISAARNPKWSLAVSVSRSMLFHSATLFGAGVYLLLMAAAGYYLRFFGGSWGAVLQAVFLFGALLLLGVTLSSGTFRARLKVFLSKHFFSYRYDYREEWLRFTRTLSEGEPGVRLRERSIQAIAELVESPAGALWLTQESGVFERAAHWNLGVAAGLEPKDSSLAHFLENRQWVIDIPECLAEPDKYEGLDLPGWLKAIPYAWLVVPLILHEELKGFVVLVRSRGQVNLNWEVSDLLKTAGRQAASYLAQLEAAQALLVARQFESFNRMSAFVVHDLKNLVSQLSLLLKNAERHRHNPEFQQDMLETVANSVEKMKRLLLQLRAGAPASDKPGPLVLDDALRRAVAAKTGFAVTPALEISAHGLEVVADRERLERVLGHLVQNACEATPKDGRVTVKLARQENFAIIEVTDTGQGMSEQFIRDRLFRPFESSKAAGMGVGTYESRQYVHALGGRIEVLSREGQGSTFRVSLPIAQQQYVLEEPVEQRRGLG